MFDIVERNSGYWAVGDHDLEGPFDTQRQAQKWIDDHDWQAKGTTPTQDALHRIFMESCDRWADDGEVKSYLKRIEGKLLQGNKAARALIKGKKGCVVFHVVDEHPFTDCQSPMAIALPMETAFKIVALGGIP